MLPKIKYETGDGYYQLTERYVIKTPIIPPKPIQRRFYGLASNGLLTLEPGYAWNGANVVVDTQNILAASLIHDAFCQMVQRGELPNRSRWKADEYFAETLKEAGVPLWRRAYVSLGVKLYGRLWYY